jgi:hypothetical protein
MSVGHEINVPVLLHGRSLVHACRHSAQQRPTTTNGVINMGIMERDGQLSKKDAAEQPVKAQKTPQKAGLNGLLETVRQKMAYTIRGI